MANFDFIYAYFKALFVGNYLFSSPTFGSSQSLRFRFVPTRLVPEGITISPRVLRTLSSPIFGYAKRWVAVTSLSLRSHSTRSLRELVYAQNGSLQTPTAAGIS